MWLSAIRSNEVLMHVSICMRIHHVCIHINVCGCVPAEDVKPSANVAQLSRRRTQHKAWHCRHRHRHHRCILSSLLKK